MLHSYVNTPVFINLIMIVPLSKASLMRLTSVCDPGTLKMPSWCRPVKTLHLYSHIYKYSVIYINTTYIKAALSKCSISSEKLIICLLLGYWYMTVVFIICDCKSFQLCFIMCKTYLIKEKWLYDYNYNVTIIMDCQLTVLPCRLMKRMQLSTTRGICCPELW